MLVPLIVFIHVLDLALPNFEIMHPVSSSSKIIIQLLQFYMHTHMYIFGVGRYLGGINSGKNESSLISGTW